MQLAPAFVLLARAACRLAPGLLAGLLGIGGAVFTVPCLEGREVKMTHGVGTSSGVALLLSIVAVTGLAAPLGVRLARRWPVARLRRTSAGLLLFAGGGSLWKPVHL